MHRHQIVSLWDMLQLAAPDLTLCLYNLGLLSERLVSQGRAAEAQGRHHMLGDQTTITTIPTVLVALVKIASDSQMPVSKAACTRSLQHLQDSLQKSDGQAYISASDAVQLGHYLSHLSTVFHDELDGACFVFVDSRFKHYIEDAELPFGQDVDLAFPNASGDLAEAAVCLAFRRSTAVVFHLMRAMEFAVQSLAAHLGIGQLDREWGKLLSDIRTAIEAMPKGDERDEWSETLSLLYHVKQAWRNKTMHPKATYTEEEAERVFEAVRSFMLNLAGRLSP